MRAITNTVQYCCERVNESYSRVMAYQKQLSQNRLLLHSRDSASKRYTLLFKITTVVATGFGIVIFCHITDTGRR